MRRFFYSLLGLALVGGGIYWVLKSSIASSSRNAPADQLQWAPTEKIQETRNRVKEIERNSQKQSDELFKKTE